MLVSYAAYLIRCWRDDVQVQRVEIVHVQSGERTLVHSTEAALGWIDQHGRDQTSLEGNQTKEFISGNPAVLGDGWRQSGS